jgi:hypothetical protein
VGKEQTQEKLEEEEEETAQPKKTNSQTTRRHHTHLKKLRPRVYPPGFSTQNNESY